MLTVSEYAKKMQISRQRVHQYIREGRISPTPRRLGQWYVIRPNARITPPKPLMLQRWARL